ncbi:hypothetical protein F4861DRAFT_387382 [Xylaria intraflava]|nr:hypothetical protein F4861DRAFT_387382 [Xylaria intraflava]
MTITRIFNFAIADEAAQDFCVSTFNGFKSTCTKNGASYIVATHASKVKVLKDTTGSVAAITVFASITFNSEEDANYFAFEDPVNQGVKAKAEGSSAAYTVFQGTFS